MIYVTIYNSSGKKINSDNLNAKQKTFVREKLTLVREYGMNYNGYGYSDKMREYAPMTRSQVLEFNKLGKIEITKVVKSQDEIKEAWANRLVKVTEITIEQALEIAQKKIEYKEKQIDDLEERQYHKYSQKRQSLIKRIQRSNPLRRITNKDHALAIIVASERHSSDYDTLLEVAREMAEAGEIERDEVKDYARRHYKRSSSED